VFIVSCESDQFFPLSHFYHTSLIHAFCEDCMHRLQGALLRGTQLLQEHEAMPSSRELLIRCYEAKKA
jgi:hypothetical protein